MIMHPTASPPPKTWRAKMITAAEPLDSAPRLRSEFALEEGHGEIVTATLYMSALGVAEVWINGQKLGDRLLSPGWTAYEWRVRYETADVGSALDPARNVIAVQLGAGWYATPLFIAPHARYGDDPAGWIELRIVFEDGHEQVVASDETWMAGPSPIARHSLYDGQSIDAQRQDTAWLEPHFIHQDWRASKAVDFDPERLQPQFGPPVRRQETFAPVACWMSPSGKLLVDFGQNLVGWVRVAVAGPKGHVVSLRHAEVIEQGELGVRPLRSAKATDCYTLSGGADVFEPTLTFHGFRYVEVEGWPGGLQALEDHGGLTATVVGSDLARTGWFRCSNLMLNQLHDNVVWSAKGNFLSIPTDCPQRDERLGWTGDIAVFAPTAAFLFDVEAFLREWLRDVVLEQAHDQDIVPWVVPNILKYFPPDPLLDLEDTTAIWSDAIAWTPWALWRAYGDRRALEETFAGQLAHARRAWSLCSARGVWETGFQFGDWLDPDAPPERPHRAKAKPGVVATISLYRTLRIIAQAASLLQRVDEAAEFETKAEALQRAFYAAYVHDERIESDCAAVYTLAIVFEILFEADRSWAGTRLAELVRASDHRISTGFAGTPYICDALTVTGHLEDAYKMLLQTTVPSWLYAVTQGATTIWERWDSMLPSGAINPGQMTSFNHYALGAVADWIHRTVGGIAPLAAHEGRYLVAPRPGGDLQWAETRLRIREGDLVVRWDAIEGDYRVEIDVPSGATIEFRRPDGQAETLQAGSHTRLLGQ